MRGYTIPATPHEINGEKWRLHIRITAKDHQGVRTSEFPAQVLHMSEQEADIHGITFGQRVIDGKVEGMSVLDLKPGSPGDAEVSGTIPHHVFGFPNLEGTGILLDLSAGGCRIESLLTPDLRWT